MPGNSVISAPAAKKDALPVITAALKSPASSSPSRRSSEASAASPKNAGLVESSPLSIVTSATSPARLSLNSVTGGMRPSLSPGFELGAQVFELPAIRRERLPVKLDQHRSAGCDELPVTTGVQESTVRVEPVAGRVHGLGRLAVVAVVVSVLRQIRQVRDHEIDRQGNRLE